MHCAPGQFGPIEINATCEENHYLLFPAWPKSDEFLKRFPDCVAPHTYGDLIIRAAIRLCDFLGSLSSHLMRLRAHSSAAYALAKRSEVIMLMPYRRRR